MSVPSIHWGQVYESQYQALPPSTAFLLRGSGKIPCDFPGLLPLLPMCKPQCIENSFLPGCPLQVTPPTAASHHIPTHTPDIQDLGLPHTIYRVLPRESSFASGGERPGKPGLCTNLGRKGCLLVRLFVCLLSFVEHVFK